MQPPGLGLQAIGAVCSLLCSQDPLTPTLSRREREKDASIACQPRAAQWRC